MAQSQPQEPEILPPNQSLTTPIEHPSIFDLPEAQEYLGKSPVDLLRETVSPDVDPRRMPYRAYVIENGREIPNPTGTLLMGALNRL